MAVMAVIAIAACRRGDRSADRADAAAMTRTDAGPAQAQVSSLREAALVALRDARVPGLSFANVRAGRPVRCDAVGDAQVNPPRRAMPDTIFHAASIGKPVVGVTVMKLVEDGLIGLDDDVSGALPFRVAHPRSAAPSITLRRLLTHTASIRDRMDVLQRASAPGDAREALAPFLTSYLAKESTPSFLREPPGSVHEYSNVGVALAALVVEALRREPFDDVARRTVFEPLRMSAAFHTSAFDGATIATSHVWNGRRFDARPLLGRPVYPASDLRASACALGRFVSAMLGGGELDGARVLSKASVDAMLTPEPMPSGRDAALGWQLVRLDGRALAGHEGEDDGASAAMFVDRTRSVGAVVLANGDAFTSGDAARVNALNALLVTLLRDD